MNTYQQKWVDILSANTQKNNWKITAFGNDIMIEMPHVTDLKVVRDNLPDVIAKLSLDIDEPKQRLQFIIKNGYEQFEYLLNPDPRDLT